MVTLLANVVENIVATIVWYPPESEIVRIHTSILVDHAAFINVKVIFVLLIIVEQLDGLDIVLGYGCNMSEPLEIVYGACTSLATTCPHDMSAKVKHIIS